MVFKEIFKIHYEVFRILVRWLRSRAETEGDERSPFSHWIRHRRRNSMDVNTAVACGVLFLFGKGTLREKSAMLGMSRSSFERAAHMIVDELVARSNEVIFIPPMEEQVFLQCRRNGHPFPGALFAIDGTLCKLPVKGRRNDFYCRKGYACLNVQVVCDWNKNIVHVDTNYSGRTQDNDMFMASPLQALLDSSQCPLRPGGFIVGDEGYANAGHILRPFNESNLDNGQRLYNYFFKSARLIVENAIGGWKQKCPLLNIGLHKMDPENLATVVHASAVLYQFCKKTEEQLLHPSPHRYLNQRFVIPDGLIGKSAREARDFLVDYFISRYPRTYQTLNVMNGNH